MSEVVDMGGKKIDEDAVKGCRWRPGDRVVLQSGGPVMTVNFLDIESAPLMVMCAWHAEGGHPCEYGFAPEALREPT